MSNINNFCKGFFEFLYVVFLVCVISFSAAAVFLGIPIVLFILVGPMYGIVEGILTIFIAAAVCSGLDAMKKANKYNNK